MANDQQIMAKIPPHNIEAEQSVLGSLLIDKDAIIKVADIINPEDFYRDTHQLIYQAMLELFEKREPIDLLSLSNRLIEKEELEKVGGRSYLATLSTIVPSASNVLSYAKIVHKKATLRRLITSAGEILDIGYDENEDVEKLLDEAEQKLFQVSQGHLKQQFVPITNVLAEAFERIDELHRDQGKLRGIPTGYKNLDNLLAGLQKSDLVILAARPSVGKTSLALDIARHIAIREKKKVGIFSLEMSREQLVDRLLCAEANVDLWKMRTGRLSNRADDDDFPRIGHAMGILAEAQIFIDDTPMANVMEIRTKARRLQMEHGLDLIILDYLQLMEGRNRENRVQELSEITRALKGIARELNVPLLALSQLSRAVEESKPAIPKLSHLRESGSIEQDADVVLFIYRKAADRNYRYDDLTEEEKHLAEIHVAKHRNGPTGMVRLIFRDDRASFVNLEKQYVDEEGSLPQF